MTYKTEKGHGVDFLSNQEGWHGKALNPDEAKRALVQLGTVPRMTIPVRAPSAGNAPIASTAPIHLPVYDKSKPVAVCEAFGQALKAIGDARPDVCAVDAEVGNSTGLETFGKAHPDRYVQSYIAEQQMLGTCVGLAASGHPVFASNDIPGSAPPAVLLHQAGIDASHIVDAVCAISSSPAG